jgi:hypothetical protein
VTPEAQLQGNLQQALGDQYKDRFAIRFVRAAFMNGESGRQRELSDKADGGTVHWIVRGLLSGKT